MKRLMLASALVMLGCQHAKQSERDEAPPPEPTSAKEPVKEAKKPVVSEPKTPAPSEATKPPPAADRPQLSADAEGLLKPEGPKLIQEALTKKGYLPREQQTGELDDKTSNALRRFQEDEHSPRTGYPDRETVRKLGLEVDKVFKATGARKPGSDR